MTLTLKELLANKVEAKKVIINFDRAGENVSAEVNIRIMPIGEALGYAKQPSADGADDNMDYLTELVAKNVLDDDNGPMFASKDDVLNIGTDLFNALLSAVIEANTVKKKD